MKTEWVLSQEAFDTFLAWLDADRDRAGEKHEEIRGKLIEYFVCGLCTDPESSADEVIDRVGRKVPELTRSGAKDRASCFYREAQMVLLSGRRDRFVRSPQPARLWKEPGEAKRVNRAPNGVASLLMLGAAG